MGKYPQFLTAFSASLMSVFLFPADNSSKCQWIFTKLGMCIDIVEIWFRIVNRQILSIFDSYLPTTCPYDFSKNQWIFTKLGICALIL